ncbi:MAG: PKD domain-containing protein [Verrucomicrobia bacterium]|nr:PKD domain-containing protein [Verrucomicrobiota bacterium]
MKTKKASYSKRLFALCLATVIALAGSATISWAASVYLSADHHTKQFDAWNINPNGTVSYQATYSLGYATDPAGIGIDAATGVGNDPLMFITTEGAGGIEVINPITLQFHGVAPGPINMGGVDVDDINNIIFAIQRGTGAYGGSGTSELYIYSYNDDGTGIALEAHVTLPNHGAGMSLAFDDSRDILWVADLNSSMVKAYDVNVAAWSDIAEIPSLSFSVSHPPIDVTVDQTRNIVYTGGAWAGSRLLSKYEVASGTETTFDIGPYSSGLGVMGVAVEQIKGYVYLTTGGQSGSGGGNLQVWDCSSSPFVQLQATANLGNPAGIAIGGVSYGLLDLEKNDTLQGQSIPIGQNFTYMIPFANSTGYDVTGMTIIDTMPPVLDFVSETLNGVAGSGVYSSATHTVTWEIGDFSAGDTGTIELVVQINSNAVPGQTIYNYCSIFSDQTPQTTINPTNPIVVPTNLPPVAICQDVVVGTDPGVCYAHAFVDAGSYDPDGDPIAIVQIPAGPYPLGTNEVTLIVTDDGGLTDQCTAMVIVEDRTPPEIHSLWATPLVAAINQTISFTADVSDICDNDVDVVWNYDDNSGVTPDATHAYTESGVYNVSIVATDDAGNAATGTVMIVAFDPSGKFITGGGWIDSPAGAYIPNQALTGKASFGFVSRYKTGKSTPSGNTEFQFKAADFCFHSSSYDWLVINQDNDNAQYKGIGTINDEGAYRFMIWAGDSTVDTFRIRIWEEVALGVEVDVYDNGVQQAIGGGSIVIHSKKVK